MEKALSEAFGDVGVLTEIDMATFAAYCQSYARWKEAQQHIDEEGSTFETEKGYQQQERSACDYLRETRN